MNPESVLNAVANEYKVTITQLKGKSRKKPLPEARHMFYYILRFFPVPQLADFMKRHRTTPHHGIRKTAELISIYRDIKEIHDNILKSINPEDYMTIKIKYRQLEAIHLLLQHLLDSCEPENVGESLLFEIVFKINEKIRAKLTRNIFDNREGSNLTLSSIEAKAFYVWYNQNVIVAPEEQWTYERIVGSIVINQIDKVYA